MWSLRKMAWPISFIYGMIVHVRNLLYNHQILKSKSFETPTICVGNLSVGGTGKTPMIEFLISRLQDEHQLAVLSRGYKRKSKGFQLGTKVATVEQLGDEPFQIQKKYPNVTVAVDANRRNGIAQLQKHINPGLILLDDAFQHRKVRPTFSILLTTYQDPYFNDWYLPTGNLRDSKFTAERADCIVVTKCPTTLEKEKKESYKMQLSKTSKAMVLFSTLVYDPTLYGNPNTLKLMDLKGKDFTLVTGIANPAPLVNYLEEKDLVFEHLRFPDHHSFSALEIASFQEKPYILTTEKDFVRLQGQIKNLYCIKIEHQFLGIGEEQLLRAMDTKIKLYC